MAAVIFDSGGLIAIERRDRRVGALLKLAARDNVDVMTSAACVAQVWRDPARQALLTRALGGFLEVAVGPAQARDIGRLLAVARTNDVVDGAVVALAADGDLLVTSDPSDLRQLAKAAEIDVRVLAV